MQDYFSSDSNNFQFTLNGKNMYVALPLRFLSCSHCANLKESFSPKDF